MSAETFEWLNTQTLIGFTEQRGNAWHYREENQGAEPNHYPGAIPLEDVTRRLFNFAVGEEQFFIPTADGMGFVPVPGRKAMVTSDTREVLGVFKEGYQGHGYEEWLLTNVGTILDSDLGIGSAGLLKNRAQAWVSVEMPETITTPEGVAFRPYLLAKTSFDGSLATGYNDCTTFTVCDNTLQMAAREGTTFKVRHSKYSALKIGDARAALGIVHTMAEETARQIAHLCAWKVSESQWDKVLSTLVPVPEEDGRGKTVALTKQAEVTNLYRSDSRAAPWRGTALGVLQAFNTHAQHVAGVRKNALRQVRNMENVLSGKSGASDARVLEVLAGVA